MANNTQFTLISQGIGTLAMTLSVLGFLHSGANFFFKFAFVTQFGFGAIYIGLAVNTILIIMSFIVPKAVALAHKNNYLTFTDLVKQRQGSLMGHWITFASLYSAAIFITANLFVAGNIISLLTELTVAASTALIAGVIYSYIWFGGYKNVIRTDILQVGIMILLTLSAILFIDHNKDVIIKDLTSSKWGPIVLFSILALSIPAAPDIWQRFYAAKNPTVAGQAIRVAVLVDVGFSFAITAFILLALDSAIGLSDKNPLLDFFIISTAPSIAIVGFGLFVICAMLSTVDNLVFNATCVIAKNIFGDNTGRNERSFISRMRIGAFIILGLFSYISLTIGDLVQWLIQFYPVLGVLTFFMFYAVLFTGQYKYRDRFLASGVVLTAICYLSVHYISESLLLGKLCYFVAFIFIGIDYFYCQYKSNNNQLELLAESQTD